MKIISIIVTIALLILVVFFAGCASDTQVQSEPEQLASHVAPTQVPQEETPQTVFETDLYLNNGIFSPAVIAVKEGQLVRIVVENGRETLEDGKEVEVPFELSIPDLGIETKVHIADTIEFTADKTGEFEYYCVDCSPQAVGTLIVE